MLRLKASPSSPPSALVPRFRREESEHELEQRFFFASRRQALAWRFSDSDPRYRWNSYWWVVNDSALKLNLLLGCQRAHRIILDGDNIAASTWNTGSSFQYCFVLVPATDEAPTFGPSCGIVQ